MMTKHIALRVALVATICTCLTVSVSGQARPTVQALEADLQAGKKALIHRDFAAAIAFFSKVKRTLPDDPEVLSQLARAEALAGNKEQALSVLDRLVSLGFGLEFLRDPALKSVSDTQRFAELARRAEAQKTPIVHSQVAFTIPERDLIPEGMAYDPADRTFYVSSIYRRKIVAIDQTGNVRDFISEGQDGIWEVLGMKVDVSRRLLIVCSMANNHVHGGLDKDDTGRSGVWLFDLRNGKLHRKFVTAPGSGRHLFNDLVLTGNHDVYLTDSDEGSVHRLTESHLERITEPNTFLYPNGIALSPDESFLYVADAAGVYILDLRTGKTSPLPHSKDLTLVGIDGLYLHQRSLIAVQNGVEPNRILRLRLTPDLKRVERSEILSWRDPVATLPTTGAIVGDDFYYLADAQLRAFDADGKIFPVEKLKPVTISKTHLPPDSAATPGASSKLVTVPSGEQVAVDGKLSPGEWDDAAKLVIEVAPGWNSTIRYKHDGTNLLFAFSGLGSPDNRHFRYPEVLISTAADDSLSWTAHDWWFHASFRDCWSMERPNNYSTCTKETKDWEANNYESQERAPELIEFRIPFGLLGVDPTAGTPIRIAFDVTDTRAIWNFWPASAEMNSPATWPKATLQLERGNDKPDAAVP